MQRRFSILIFAITLLGSSPLLSAVKVITSTTDLAWAVREIGGNLVEVKSLLKGKENPHYVDAVPEFIRLAAEAQVACVVGLDLEIGWMPKVLARSGNAQIQPGGKGYCEMGKAISVLELPAGGVDRSMGDVHPRGNPHFWLSPTSFAESLVEISRTLISIDPSHAKEYLQGVENLKKKLTTIHQRNLTKVKPLLTARNAVNLVEYHREFAYLLNAYELKSFGSVEEKPGIAPSAGRLAEIAISSKAAGVKFLLAAETSPKATVERFAELSHLPIVQVPISVQAEGRLNDYGALQDYLVDSIVKALQGQTT